MTCKPDCVEEVRREIARRRHSEVRQSRADSLVIVTDTHSLGEDRREVEELERLPGVIAAHVVFSNMEDTFE